MLNFKLCIDTTQHASERADVGHSAATKQALSQRPRALHPRGLPSAARASWATRGSRENLTPPSLTRPDSHAFLPTQTGKRPAPTAPAHHGPLLRTRAPQPRPRRYAFGNLQTSAPQHANNSSPPQPRGRKGEPGPRTSQLWARNLARTIERHEESERWAEGRRRAPFWPPRGVGRLGWAVPECPNAEEAGLVDAQNRNSGAGLANLVGTWSSRERFR